MKVLLLQMLLLGVVCGAQSYGRRPVELERPRVDTTNLSWRQERAHYAHALIEQSGNATRGSGSVIVNFSRSCKHQHGEKWGASIFFWRGLPTVASVMEGSSLFQIGGAMVCTIHWMQNGIRGLLQHAAFYIFIYPLCLLCSFLFFILTFTEVFYHKTGGKNGF